MTKMRLVRKRSSSVALRAQKASWMGPRDRTLVRVRAPR